MYSHFFGCFHYREETLHETFWASFRPRRSWDLSAGRFDASMVHCMSYRGCEILQLKPVVFIPLFIGFQSFNHRWCRISQPPYLGWGLSDALSGTNPWTYCSLVGTLKCSSGAFSGMWEESLIGYKPWVLAHRIDISTDVAYFYCGWIEFLLCPTFISSGPCVCPWDPDDTYLRRLTIRFRSQILQNRGQTVHSWVVYLWFQGFLWPQSIRKFALNGLIPAGDIQISADSTPPIFAG